MPQAFNLIRENQRKILQGTDEPKILIGGMNNSHFPNFHTESLLEQAAVVSITSEKSDLLRPDRLYVPMGADINSCLPTLPKHFKPDFFWDGQVVGRHRIYKGLDRVPFPTLVGSVHIHKGKSWKLDKLFDRVFVPSSGVASRYGFEHEPLALCWGSLSSYFRSSSSKDVDVSCTLGEGETVRARVVHKLTEISKEHPEWNIQIVRGIDKPAYRDLLSRSKIGIHVGDWGNQATYRPFEIIASEAALLFVNETDPFGTCLSETIPFGIHSSTETLEEDISRLLHDPDRLTNVRKAYEWVEEHLSYEKQWSKVIEYGMSTKRLRFGDDWALEAASVVFDGSNPGLYLSQEHTVSMDHDETRRDLNLTMITEVAESVGVNVFGLDSWKSSCDPRKLDRIPEPNLIPLDKESAKKLAWAGPDADLRQEAYRQALEAHYE